MDEARGTLFWNICEILEARSPTVVLLENVRNIAGPRHTHEWDVIIRSLRELGYQVSSTPDRLLAAPAPARARGTSAGPRARLHHRRPTSGRESSHVDVEPAVPHAPVDGWSPTTGTSTTHLPAAGRTSSCRHGCQPAALAAPRRPGSRRGTTSSVTLRAAGVEQLPGFPVWVDAFVHEDDLVIADGTPDWKANFLRKNAAFYTAAPGRSSRRGWTRWNYLRDFPPSRRKFEWQAQDANVAGRDGHAPASVRPAREAATYVPALVAITQTSILGDRRRRLSPREAARLQGLPEWFDFGDQPDAATYKQMGNGVNVGAAYHVLPRARLA